MQIPTDNDLSTFRSPSSISNSNTQQKLLMFVNQINDIRIKLQEGKTSIGGIKITWNCGIVRNYNGTFLSAGEILGYVGSNGPYPGQKLSNLIVKVNRYLKQNQLARMKQDANLFYPGVSLQQLSARSVTYSLSTESSVSYSETFTITLTSSNVPNGTTVGYVISGVTTSEINNASLSGVFVVNSNSSSLTLTNMNDGSLESNFTITLSEYDTNGSSTSSEETSTILNQNKTYVLTSTTDEVNEGSSFTVNLTTTNVADSTTVGYTVTGVTSSDINNDPLLGTFIITSNEASKIFTITADLTTEGSETFTITLDGTDSTGYPTESLSKSITINDISRGDPVEYLLSASTDTIREGDSVTFTINALVNNGTTVGYSIEGVSSDDIGEALTGIVEINSRTYSKIVTLAIDYRTEGTETLSFTLDPTDSANNSTGSASDLVTILDTSVNTYSLSIPLDVASYGETFDVILSSTVLDDSTVEYTIAGVVSSDINNSLLTGEFDITSDNVTKQFTVTTSDSKEFTLTLDEKDSSNRETYSISTSININSLYNFNSHTFTNTGATGKDGPTINQMRSAYTSEWTVTSDFLNMDEDAQGIQIWTVPITGMYRITAAGAAGGTHRYLPTYPGGTGAVITGDFNLTQSDKIRILVGQMGGDSQNIDNAAPGGGGGTYVFNTTTDATPLIVAGGGGGGSRNDYALINANANSENGNAAQNKSNGGEDGNGGRTNAGGNSYWAGGGAGWLTDGTAGDNPTDYDYDYDNNYGSAQGGRVPRNGGIGGERYNDGNDEGGDGGFGGGGGGGSDNMGTGGGGGYSGGGGGNSTPDNGAGGGGGSYNGGTNTSSDTANSSNGYVTIVKL